MDTQYVREDFSRQIITWQRITTENQFCLTNNGMMALDSMAFLSNIEKFKYWLLAFLNSDVIYCWIKWNVHQYGDTGYRLSNQYVENIPIPMPIPEYEEEIKYWINTNGNFKIKKLVCEIYGLDSDEIKFIEFR